MKRVKNIWTNFVSRQNAIMAIYNGTANKRQDHVVKRKLGYDDNLPEHYGKLDPVKVELYADKLISTLENGWQPSPVRHKTIAPPHGKKREIDSPALFDHIINWMLIQAIYKPITRGMYHHSYGSIPERGIGGAKETIERWVQRDKTAKYFVKLDISKFYPNVDHEILKRKLARVIGDKRILEVLYRFIDCINFRLADRILQLPMAG